MRIRVLAAFVFIALTSHLALASRPDCEDRLLIPSVLTRGLSKKDLDVLKPRPSDVSPEEASQWIANNGWKKRLDLQSPAFEGLMRSALVAHRKGLAPSSSEVGTLFLFQEAAREVQPILAGSKVIPALTSSDALDSRVLDMFSADTSYYQSVRRSMGLPPSFDLGLDAVEINRLTKNISGLPASERWVLVLNLTEPSTRNGAWMHSPWFRFSRFSEKKDGNRIYVPSIGIFQAYLDTKYGADAVILRPELGISSAGVIQDDISLGARPFFIQPPGADYLHGEFQGNYFGSLHDIIHAERDSHVSKTFRRIIGLTAKYLEEHPAIWDLARHTLTVNGYKVEMPSRISDSEELARWIEALADSFYSIPVSKDLTGAKRVSAELTRNFGSVSQVNSRRFQSEGGLGLFIIAMAMNKDEWAARGIDVDAIVADLGPDALALYKHLTP